MRICILYAITRVQHSESWSSLSHISAVFVTGWADPWAGPHLTDLHGLWMDMDWVDFVRSQFKYNLKYIFTTFLYRMVLHISNQLRKAQTFPFEDGYSLARSKIPNKKKKLAGWAWASKPWASMGSGWDGLSVHRPGLGWAMGWPARDEHFISALVRPSVAWFFEDC